MLVMILERSPESLKGELSRWLNEPKSGVFVGNVSARVRDELWALAIRKTKDGSVMQIWTDTACPQGYRCRSHGKPSRSFIDFEGIVLVRTPPAKKKEPKQQKQLDLGADDAPPEQPQ